MANVTDMTSADNVTGMVSEEWPWLARAVDVLTYYYMPALITVGLIGNTASTVLFLGTFLRRLSLSVYLAALAISDSGFLISLLLGWAEAGERAMFHTAGVCQLVVFLSYTCSFLSVWYVVAFTVERYIAICHPLQRPRMCTRGRAQKVVISLSACAVLAYSCNFWTTGIIYNPVSHLRTCTPFRRYYVVHVVLTYVDAIATLFVPFLVIVVFNIVITHRIAYYYRKRESLMSSALFGRQNARQCRAQIKVTKMLMVVSSVFVFTNLPSYVVRCRVFLLTFVDGQPSSTSLDLHVQKLVQFPYYTNFAVNFFLYALASRKFRVAICHLCLKVRTRLDCVTSCGTCTWCRPAMTSQDNAEVTQLENLRRQSNEQDEDLDDEISV